MQMQSSQVQQRTEHRDVIAGRRVERTLTEALRDADKRHDERRRFANQPARHSAFGSLA